MSARNVTAVATISLVIAATLLPVEDGYYDWPAPTPAGSYPSSTAPSTVSRLTDSTLDILGIDPIDRLTGYPDPDPRGFPIEQDTAIREALIKHLVLRGDIIRDWEITEEAERIGERGVTATLSASNSAGQTNSASFYRFILEDRGGWKVSAEYFEGTAIFCGSRLSPVEVGQITYVSKGCNACHSLDGTASTGPSFKNLFGRREQMSDGTFVTVNETYIRRSILYPDQEIVNGYDNWMPSYSGRIRDEHIDGIIALLRSLQQVPEGEPDQAE